MKPTRSVLAAWLLAMALPAQSGGQQPANVAEYDKLVAEWTAASRAYAAANKALLASEAYKAAAKAKDQAKINELRATVVRPDVKAFGARAVALADQFAGEASVPFLTYAAANFADEDTIKAVVERVLKNHTKSPQLGVMLENAMSLSRFVGQEQSNLLLERVIADNQNPETKAWAIYWQSVALSRNKEATAEDKLKAEQLLAEAGKLAAGTILGDRIAAPTFEKERLQIGMEAPDIAGEDLDGASFKLSDYRGKVVVLDYWGFW